MSVWYIVYGNRGRPSPYDFDGIIKINGRWYNILYDVGFRTLYFEEEKKYNLVYLDIVALNEKFIEENIDSIMDMYRSVGTSDIHYFYYTLFRSVRWGYMAGKYDETLDFEICYPEYWEKPEYVLKTRYYVKYKRKRKLSFQFIDIFIDPNDLETITGIYFSNAFLLEGKELEYTGLTKFDDLRRFPTIYDLQTYIVDQYRKLKGIK